MFVLLVVLVMADARALGMQLSSARCLLSIDWGNLVYQVTIHASTW